MKAINQLEALIGDMKYVFAPVLQTQLESLIVEIKAELEKKPIVVIHLEGGLITSVESTHDLSAIKVDYDIEGLSDIDLQEVIETPNGDDAFIDHYHVDVFADPAEALEWVALANQE